MIDKMIGKIFVDVRVVGEDECLMFVSEIGSDFKIYHDQDCSEKVWLEQVDGDLSDLINAEILTAEIVTSGDAPPPPSTDAVEVCYTWTFIKFRTIKGDVTLRWFGTSNGFYSEDVDVLEVEKK